MSSIFDLVKRANELEVALVESGGEITDIITQIEDDLKTDLAIKAEQYSFVIERMKSNVEFYRAQAKKYSTVAQSIEKTEDRIKELLKLGMGSMGLSEILGDSTKIVLSQTKPKLVIEDESLVPQEYKTVVQTIELDKDKIKTALELNKEVPGAHLAGGLAIRFYPNKEKK